MGSNTSKPGEDTSTQKIETDPDPRSPTPEISRTPLQGKTGGKHSNITKNADLRKTFESSNVEEKVILNNPILSAVIKNHLQSYDPRSPASDFERTPLYIASKIEKLDIDNSGSPCLREEATDENDHKCFEVQEEPAVVPKNLCNGFYDLSLNETNEPLGSSTASNDVIENDIDFQAENKDMQLLETNFDYIETEQHEVNEEFIGHSESSVDSSFKHIPLFKILNIDPRSPSAGIERTPIVVAKDVEGPCEEQVENMSDDKLIKVLQDTNIDLRNSVGKSAHEGLLIYEDVSNNFLDTPKKPKTGSTSGSRTPLSCMKNKAEAGHARSKSANTLEDPKGQNQISKLPKRMSHIPRLKSLQTRLAPTSSTISLKNISKKTAIGGDCENTPPHSHRDKWDKDSSIVL